MKSKLFIKHIFIAHNNEGNIFIKTKQYSDRLCWSKGLTKESDDRLLSLSKKVKKTCSEKKKHFCKDCNQGFSSVGTLKDHLRKTGHQRCHECKHCGTVIEDTKKRGYHQSFCKSNPKIDEISYIRFHRKNRRPNHVFSQETRKKISMARRRYLLEHPEINPYYLKSKNGNLSYYEKAIFEKLKELRVDGFKMNCRSGIYYYDIAFPEFKVDIELDGNTHNSEKRLKRDRERDEWTISRGWRVLRIRNEAIKKSLDFAISEILEFLKSHNIHKTIDKDMKIKINDEDFLKYLRTS
jgi:very-short-patch-repair endonuclease